MTGVHPIMLVLLVSLFVAWIVAIRWVVFNWRTGQVWFAAPAVLWLLNCTIFSARLILGDLYGIREALNLWSQLILVQAAWTFGAYFVMMGRGGITTHGRQRNRNPNRPD